MERELRRQISSGVVSLGLEATAQAVESSLSHLLLLKRWLRVYNLSNIKSLEEMVVKHLLDSISAVPFVTGQRVIDVGSGAGFPGIPMAIFLPETMFYLMDGNGKKIRFLVESKSRLQLENVEIINSRLEDHTPNLPYDMVVCRAFGSLEKIILGCSRLVGSAGKLIAMKGDMTKDELFKARQLCADLTINRLKVPDLNSSRNIVEILPQSPP